MKAHLKEIRPGKGLGTLLFGKSREQVKAMLGKPEEVERYSLSDEEGDATEAWHYDDLGLSLSFDEEFGWKLSSIAVSSADFTLDGQSLIGKNKAEVMEAFRANEWGELEEDVEVSEDDPDSCLMHVDESRISLWFEQDELTEIQIGPFYRNEEIIWPEEA